jgi:hypothetical protein
MIILSATPAGVGEYYCDCGPEVASPNSPRATSGHFLATLQVALEFEWRRTRVALQQVSRGAGKPPEAVEETLAAFETHLLKWC